MGNLYGVYPHIAQVAGARYDLCMALTHSIAAKKRWAKIPKEERSKRMSRLAKLSQAKLSPEAKRKHALKMVRAKHGK